MLFVGHGTSNGRGGAGVRRVAFLLVEVGESVLRGERGNGVDGALQGLNGVVEVVLLDVGDALRVSARGVLLLRFGDVQVFQLRTQII